MDYALFSEVSAALLVIYDYEFGETIIFAFLCFSDILLHLNRNITIWQSNGTNTDRAKLKFIGNAKC